MDTEKNNYRLHLEKVPQLLENLNDQIQTIIINLAMSGESSSINDLFDEGEELVFKYEDFKDSTDINVRILYGIFNFLQDERVKIINLNSIKGNADLDDELPF